MSNELTKFKSNVPPDEHVYLWWDEDQKEWRVWFADPGKTGELEFPMFKDDEFTLLQTTFYRFRRSEI